MDHAQRGKTALEAKKYSQAIEHYNAAIAVNPRAVDYYIYRSEALHRSNPPNYEAALADADLALVLAKDRMKRESIMDAQQRRFITLYQLGRYADARKLADVMKAMNDKDKEKGSDKAKKRDGIVSTWGMKIDRKIKELTARLEETDLTETEKEALKQQLRAVVLETPEVQVPTAENKLDAERKPTVTQNASQSASAPAKPVQQTAAKDIKHDWIQSTENVTVTLKAKGVPKDKALVEILERSLTISFPTQGTSSMYDFSIEPLYAAVDPSKSTYNITPNKVEIILKKQNAEKWRALEGNAEDLTDTVDNSKPVIPPAILNSSAPAYPTSSRSGPKDWDKVAKDLTRKPKDAGKESTGKEEYDDLDAEDGGDDVNYFFKKLYANADPDTRRAMMKSYQESNGTALSTNWAEVSKGEVETTPPDGMEAKKWGQ